MDAASQLMIMQQNAQQYQMQQQQQMMQMHNAPIGGGAFAPLPPSPRSYGTQIIYRCGYDSQNRRICWRVN